MDFARHQYETDVLREQLRIREEVSSKYSISAHICFLMTKLAEREILWGFYADQKIA